MEISWENIKEVLTFIWVGLIPFIWKIAKNVMTKEETEKAITDKVEEMHNKFSQELFSITKDYVAISKEITNIKDTQAEVLETMRRIDKMIDKSVEAATREANAKEQLIKEMSELDSFVDQINVEQKLNNQQINNLIGIATQNATDIKNLTNFCYKEIKGRKNE